MSKDATVIGIDPSLRATAVCVLRLNEEPRVLSLGSESLGTNVNSRIYRFEELVKDIDTATFQLRGLGHQEFVAFIEGYSHASKFNSAFLGEFGGLLRAMLTNRCDTVVEVPPQSLKKFVTGKGNAEKSAMMMHVLKRWGHTSENDDCADAFALAKLGQAYLGIIECDNEAQRQVIDALKNPKPKKRKAKA